MRPQFGPTGNFSSFVPLFFFASSNIFSSVSSRNVRLNNSCESFSGEYPGLYNEFGKTRSLHFLTERKENAIFHGRVTRTRKVKNRESREICRTPTRNIDFDIYRSESWDPRAYTRHIRSVNLWNLWGKKEEWKNRRIFFINCGNISCRSTTNH